jgi:cold shock CspA family protein
MSTGRIAIIQADKGFGFITAAGPQRDGDLLFFRWAVTGVKFDDLREGQIVRFEKERDPQSPGRYCAVSVHPVAVGTGERR